MVLGDATQLGQLFQNLLSNALKFRQVCTPPVILIQAQLVGPFELPTSLKLTRAVESYHQIEVIENGIGFEQKYVDHSFQVFQRLQGRNAFEGTGIGLAICEKVAANHGGAITAISHTGQGATFRVYLPEVVRFSGTMNLSDLCNTLSQIVQGFGSPALNASSLGYSISQCSRKFLFVHPPHSKILPLLVPPPSGGRFGGPIQNDSAKAGSSVRLSYGSSARLILGLICHNLINSFSSADTYCPTRSE